MALTQDENILSLAVIVAGIASSCLAIAAILGSFFATVNLNLSTTSK